MGAVGDANHVIGSKPEVKARQASIDQALNPYVCRTAPETGVDSFWFIWFLRDDFKEKFMSLRDIARIEANSPLYTNFQTLGTSFNLTFQSSRANKRKWAGPL